MKIIATGLNPVELAAIKMYDSEFKEDNGIVLFPEHSFENCNKFSLEELSQKYGITLVGTENEHGIEQALIVKKGETIKAQTAYPDMIQPELFQTPIMAKANMKPDPKQELRFFEQDQIYDVSPDSKKISGIIRICSDIRTQFSKDGKADLLFVPSEIPHPEEFFKEHLEALKFSLDPNAKVVYATAETNEKWLKPGIYNLNMEMIGKNMGNYAVFNYQET